MSSAYKCDRCKDLFPIRKFSLNCRLTRIDMACIDYRYRYREYDLCPQCQAELERWFNNVQSEEN